MQKAHSQYSQKRRNSDVVQDQFWKTPKFPFYKESDVKLPHIQRQIISNSEQDDVFFELKRGSLQVERSPEALNRHQHQRLHSKFWLSPNKITLLKPSILSREKTLTQQHSNRQLISPKNVVLPKKHPLLISDRDKQQLFKLLLRQEDKPENTQDHLVKTTRKLTARQFTETSETQLPSTFRSPSNKTNRNLMKLEQNVINKLFKQ